VKGAPPPGKKGVNPLGVLAIRTLQKAKALGRSLRGVRTVRDGGRRAEGGRPRTEDGGGREGSKLRRGGCVAVSGRNEAARDYSREVAGVVKQGRSKNFG
jgi:hypothetical protein